MIAFSSTSILRHLSHCLLAVSFICGAILVFAEEKDHRPVNEQLTSAAWDAFNSFKLEDAINKADQCIKLFRRDADDLQLELKSKSENQPRVGKVNDAEKNAILNRGPLNDVATCYFIQGEAYSKLAARAEGTDQQKILKLAKTAYEKAANYTYARTWDPNGWFWNPAKTAITKIEDLPAIKDP